MSQQPQVIEQLPRALPCKVTACKGQEKAVRALCQRSKDSMTTKDCLAVISNSLKVQMIYQVQVSTESSHPGLRTSDWNSLRALR